jgi:hypothetical protein
VKDFLSTSSDAWKLPPVIRYKETKEIIEVEEGEEEEEEERNEDGEEKGGITDSNVIKAVRTQTLYLRNRCLCAPLTVRCATLRQDSNSQGFVSSLFLLFLHYLSHILYSLFFILCSLFLVSLSLLLLH